MVREKFNAPEGWAKSSKAREWAEAGENESSRRGVGVGEHQEKKDGDREA